MNEQTETRDKKTDDTIKGEKKEIDIKTIRMIITKIKRLQSFFNVF